VELFPSRLAGDSPAGLAAALREAFALVVELDKVVLFIDEVEEIAGARQPRTVSAAQGEHHAARGPGEHHRDGAPLIGTLVTRSGWLKTLGFPVPPGDPDHSSRTGDRHER
jgi:hypothetical protein